MSLFAIQVVGFGGEGAIVVFFAAVGFGLAVVGGLFALVWLLSGCFFLVFIPFFFLDVVVVRTAGGGVPYISLLLVIVLELREKGGFCG